MSETLISWERVRALRDSGVLQDFDLKRIFCNGDRKAVVVYCGDSRLIWPRIDFLLRRSGIEGHGNSFNGGIVRCDPRYDRGRRLNAEAAAEEIEESVRLTGADVVLGMGDTPCKKVDEKALDADALMQAIFVGSFQLQRRLRRKGYNVRVFPVFHTRVPETVDRDLTYLLNPGLYGKLTGFDPRHV